jgi:sugar-specific transcriptional regulator TrmB
MIYLSLLKAGRTTARILCARTGITRPSVYDQLKSLIALGLVVELDIEGKAHFGAADLKYLDALLTDKIDRLEQSRSFLKDALPSLIDSVDTVTPKLRFFEGSEGIKQLLKDIMWHSNITLSIIWPPLEMEKVFEGAFLRWFDERRGVRKLSMHVLRPSEKTPTPLPFIIDSKDAVADLPQTQTITMASIIYDSKTAFISSGREAFGFIVESTEFAQLQKLQFEILWRMSV